MARLVPMRRFGRLIPRGRGMMNNWVADFPLWLCSWFVGKKNQASMSAFWTKNARTKDELT
jgi:hypothetical protein